jgi:hypothetical protein
MPCPMPYVGANVGASILASMIAAGPNWRALAKALAVLRLTGRLPHSPLYVVPSFCCYCVSTGAAYFHQV